MQTKYSADQLRLGDWELLPFRFQRFDSNRVLLTNSVGEHLIVGADDFAAFTTRTLSNASPTFRKLRSKHFLRGVGEALPIELLAMKILTRYSRLPELTALHIFVVTLRCEHACRYCQVSRQNSGDNRYDMTQRMAEQGLDIAFSSPSQVIKLEFQGGEPLLNFPLIEWIVANAQQRNVTARKSLAFVIATNLALLDDDVLAFCAANDVAISTSLDGPQDITIESAIGPAATVGNAQSPGFGASRKHLDLDSSAPS